MNSRTRVLLSGGLLKRLWSQAFLFFGPCRHTRLPLRGILAKPIKPNAKVNVAKMPWYTNKRRTVEDPEIRKSSYRILASRLHRR